MFRFRNYIGYSWWKFNGGFGLCSCNLCPKSLARTGYLNCVGSAQVEVTEGGYESEHS